MNKSKKLVNMVENVSFTKRVNENEDIEVSDVIDDDILNVFDNYDVSICGVYKDNNDEYQAEIEFYSGLGEDVIEYVYFDGTRDSFIDGLNDLANDFDPEEHAEPYIENRGNNGIPNSIKDLLNDAEEIKETLMDLANEVVKLR